MNKLTLMIKINSPAWSIFQLSLIQALPKISYHPTEMEKIIKRAIVKPILKCQVLLDKATQVWHLWSKLSQILTMTLQMTFRNLVDF